MGAPAYTRLNVDERRRQLLARATELFATHGYDELSMAKLAREAGISKPLLYHYFPSKRDLFEAVLGQAAEEHLRRIATDGALPPADQLTSAVDAYLTWIEANRGAYEKLLRSAGIPEVRELIDRVREETATRILDGIAGAAPPPPKVRAAVRAWLWYMDGVCLDWVREGDLTREDVHGLLLGTLVGALTAAGFDPSRLGAASGTVLPA
ncbi:MAG TPA: TetR/AcrR family transcriptional regulator [Solirubrobacteraceae bacterium]|nr:TetR/AcrR family transcriptional regulator [Solirubrobacteraceae bacterium]